MIFFSNKPISDFIVEFEAVENEISIGKCLLDLSDKIADVTELTYSEECPYVVEGLLRSAYNYAGIKGCYMASCSARGIDAFLDRMNFQKQQNKYIGDIPSILMGSCCK